MIRIEEADKIVGSTDGLEGKLTPKQVESWRRVLLGVIGPYALIMPVKAVQAMRDKCQEQADSLPSDSTHTSEPKPDSQE